MEKVIAKCPQPVWTDQGWLELKGVYDVHDEFLPSHNGEGNEFFDEDFCMTIIVDQPNNSPLSKVLGVHIRFLNVNKIDFEIGE